MSIDQPDNSRRPPIRVLLFGEPRLLTPNGASLRVKSQRASLLLAYLAHFSYRQHSREQLIEVLWPESDGDSGRARLRNVLSELRRVIESVGGSPDSVITATRTSIEFTPNSVETDVA